mmetsp:Transcript_9751/g.21898  ORF Transcript_9751/g.21898 Transcript_9751/m.21898 type:complete len:85 (-) Transcript_9751:50-304(-)
MHPILAAAEDAETPVAVLNSLPVGCDKFLGSDFYAGAETVVTEARALAEQAAAGHVLDDLIQDWRNNCPRDRKLLDELDTAAAA